MMALNIFTIKNGNYLMKKAIRIVAALPGVMFFLIGMQWIFSPATAAGAIGMEVLDGMARSSQIGDLGSFFLAGSCMIFLGVYTLNRTWFYAASLLVGGAAVIRTLAWTLQDAPLATQSITVEVVITIILLLAASKICEKA